jgi:hypothetical protein
MFVSNKQPVHPRSNCHSRASSNKLQSDQGRLSALLEIAEMKKQLLLRTASDNQQLAAAKVKEHCH